MALSLATSPRIGVSVHGVSAAAALEAGTALEAGGAGALETGGAGTALEAGGATAFGAGGAATGTTFFESMLGTTGAALVSVFSWAAFFAAINGGKPIVAFGIYYFQYFIILQKYRQVLKITPRPPLTRLPRQAD